MSVIDHLNNIFAITGDTILCPNKTTYIGGNGMVSKFVLNENDAYIMTNDEYLLIINIK